MKKSNDTRRVFKSTAPTKSDISEIAKQRRKSHADTIAAIASNDLAGLALNIAYEGKELNHNREELAKRFGISAAQFQQLENFGLKPLRSEPTSVDRVIRMLAHAGYVVTFSVSPRP